MRVDEQADSAVKAARIPGPLKRKIGQALHDWQMLSQGDRVLIAVSGGIDSLVAAWVLQHWRAKAPITYELEAIHIVNGFAGKVAVDEVPAESIGYQLRSWGIPFSVIDGWPAPESEPPNCFICARNRRSQLFDLARQRGCSKLALGHHKDDLIETFFINTLYSGNISTMLPRQELFAGRLNLIRVLSYLEKKEVLTIAEVAGIEPITDRCPLAGTTRRTTVRDLLTTIYERIPGAKGSLFAALGNVRHEYLLTGRQSASGGCRSGTEGEYDGLS
ncbi:MAG: tRNA 2-thiocytidine biosynthesis protein TtcA [Desulfofustis sp.]|nr:tRNA 2-thiocytidine biosynthesis protein TtcA [Desulfofustis sp.]